MKTLALLLCLLAPMVAWADVEEIEGAVQTLIIEYPDTPDIETAIVPRVGKPVLLPRGVHLPPGRAKVRGRRQARGREEISERFLLDGEATPLPPLVEAAVPANLGPQRVLAVLASFSDRPDPIATLDTLRAAYADWVVPYYDEMSESRTAIAPEFYRVAGPLAWTCSVFDITTAVVAALDPLVDFSTVDFANVAAPTTGPTWATSCKFRGIAPLGPYRLCRQTNDGEACFGYNLVDSTIPLKAIGLVTDHEEGHSYGAHHSGFYHCGPGTSIRPAPFFFCARQEYGGLPSDMGCADCAGHFDAAQKDGIGLAEGRTFDVTVPGTYRIACNDTVGLAGPKRLRLARGAGNAGAMSIECRTADATRFARELMAVKPTCDWPRGILVHVMDGHPTKPMLLDVTPGDSPSPCTPSLLPGETWTDPVMGISIRLAARMATEALVDVLSLGTPDLTMPEIVPAFRGGEVLSGIVEVTARITDDALAAVNLYSTPPWPSRHGVQTGPGPDFMWTVDTTRFPDGSHWWWYEASDEVGNRKVTQAIHTTIRNGTVSTTTTTAAPSTSSTSSSTTTPPPTTTTTSSSTSTMRPSTTTTTRAPTTTTTLICLAWGEVCGGAVPCCSRNCKGGWWKKHCR